MALSVRLISQLALIFLLSFSLRSMAADNAAPQVHSALDNAVEAMQRAGVEGPKEIDLGNQAVLKLPQGFIYIPVREARVFMRELGNYVGSNFYGLILHHDIDGFISIDYTSSGYIKDDDAKEWNADELLDNLKEGTREANKERVKKGIAPIEILGWIEKPNYEQATHRLVWSAALRDEGSNMAENDQGVNYNTYLLGREGYLSLNLVTNRGTVNEEKPKARQLLNAVTFNNGKRYSDFNASTDRVAEYGLAALIGGIAAKKLGLLAMMGVAFVKFWKIILVGIFAVGAIFRKLFSGKKKPQPAQDDAGNETVPETSAEIVPETAAITAAEKEQQKV
ncbi:DUF2167 domain-containing protein [Dickeya fangzhongdai]|uniref:DUF2167 domain-containing protein n=1 Tax=Dickeya fangzhongdai TaxID=1778540 RepID=UPI0008FF88DA